MQSEAERLTQARKNIGMNRRQYKAAMRRQMKALKRAIWHAGSGCAYMPKEAYEDFNAIAKAIDRIVDRISVERWGR
jgi:hypothetical protein